MDNEIEILRKRLLDIRTQIAFIVADHSEKYTKEEKRQMIKNLEIEAKKIHDEIGRKKFEEIRKGR